MMVGKVGVRSWELPFKLRQYCYVYRYFTPEAGYTLCRYSLQILANNRSSFPNRKRRQQIMGIWLSLGVRNAGTYMTSIHVCFNFFRILKVSRLDKNCPRRAPCVR